MQPELLKMPKGLYVWHNLEDDKRHFFYPVPEVYFNIVESENSIEVSRLGIILKVFNHKVCITDSRPDARGILDYYTTIRRI